MADDPALKGVIKLAMAAKEQDRQLPSIIRLAGDASSRRYYRASFGENGSVVVMAAPDRGSVETFLSMTALMKELGADTPELLMDQDNLLAMEDLGDVMLQGALASMPGDDIEDEYRRLLDRLAAFQAAARARVDKSQPCFSLRFDMEKLTYEVDFAGKYFLKEHLGREPHWSASAVMKLEWEKVNGELAQEMETLAHRDFHSRNIMAHGARRVWIDYQDARMGRMAYDLVSLLLDPYVKISQGMEGRLAGYYFGKMEDIGSAIWSRDRFEELYALSAAQRLYKALGTYGYQTAIRGTVTYVPYIKPAASRLLRILEGRQRLGRLLNQLGPYLEDALK